MTVSFERQYLDPVKLPVIDKSSKKMVRPGNFDAVSGRILPVLYFGVPQNEKLISMWDIVADRMFKIHNCRDIDGNIRQLPLFQPPIDPALLVKARAAGLSIASVLGDISGANMPYYRFRNVLAKAVEFANDVKSLGNAILSALEKKDAEKLAVLRQTIEVDMLTRMKTLKENAVSEAKENLAALKKNYKGAEHRRDYYNSRKFISPDEQKSLDLRIAGQSLSIASGTIRLASSIAAAFPQASIGFPCNFVTTGGLNVSTVLNGVADSVSVIGQGMQLGADITGTRASYKRREDDWKFQGKGAEIELTAMDRQIIAAEIRLAIAEADLANHKQQIKNAEDVATVMTRKFTNEQLYDWMVSQLSSVYFISYDMAYRLAKKAELAYKYELGMDANVVSFGYWNSLHRGLLAGELLSTDIRKLELKYMDNNARRYEITQNFEFDIVVVAGNPDKRGFFEKTLDFNSTGYETLENKRVKGVRVTIPCIVGPYENVAAKLTVSQSGVVVKSMITSSGNNDGGMLTFNFDDERYLPFEGVNLLDVESPEDAPKWTLELLGQVSENETAEKAILAVSYTATN
ncbi:MAG TPA: hypothetical protein VLJ60_00555 [bacterium]|nr:hypothetical protein [bacterium]